MSQPLNLFVNKQNSTCEIWRTREEPLLAEIKLSSCKTMADLYNKVIDVVVTNQIGVISFGQIMDVVDGAVQQAFGSYLKGQVPWKRRRSTRR